MAAPKKNASAARPDAKALRALSVEELRASLAE